VAVWRLDSSSHRLTWIECLPRTDPHAGTL
jgi:hypothetical protein